MEEKQATTIIAVIHQSGQGALVGNATLFEATSGPHAGLRGADVQLYDALGPIHWDRSQVSLLETGERLPAWMVPGVEA